MNRIEEVDAKLARVRRCLEEKRLRGALFATHGNFAWITGGGQNHVSATFEHGAAGVLVTVDSVYLIADNIERRRLEEEELTGVAFAAREFPWWSGSPVEEALRLVPAAELAADISVPGAAALDGAALHTSLLPPEIERYRSLGEDVGVVLTHAAFHCRPALSEHQLAGMLARGLVDFGITPAVTLAAVDGRAYTRRHPMPTEQRLDNYVVLVVGARRRGLHLAATRLVHFGPVPEGLRQRHLACARVDAAFLAATWPGARLGDTFEAGRKAYAAEGCPDEWRHHHQGGPTGYAGHGLRVTSSTPGTVQAHQAFAWNSSIAGVRSEDTVLVLEDGLEVLSLTPDLPVVEVEAGERRFSRPAILER